ncbi:MAG: response regulator, partial [Luteibaculum sp.]
VATKTLKKQWENINITIADNGQIAVDLVTNNNYDIILMDIQMPIMDGVEAMKQIKLLEKKNKKETPIIALTAHALIEERERYLAAGMNDYLSKPFKPENLYQVVFSQLGKEAEQNTPLVRVYEEEPKPKNNKPKSNKPVDLSSLREMVGNEQEVVREMLEIFKEDTPIYLENIERELAKENWESVAKTCHTLKSSIGFMGRTDLVEMAKQLQTQKTKPAKNHPIRDTLDTFVSEISKVVQYVEENPNLSEED